MSANNFNNTVEEIMDTVSVDDSAKMNERKEMIKKADDLISKLGDRKNKVTNLLQGKLERSDWGTIRNTSLEVDMRGQISSNSLLNTLRSAAEPILQQFSEDLVAIRTKVTLILSNINDEEEDSIFTEGTGAVPTPALQLITIIQVIQNMSQWSSDIMDTWVTYHITRVQLKEGIDGHRLVADKTFEGIDDMCQALILWDCKLAKEMKSMLNTLLFNYINLEDFVLVATGAVAETPHSPGYV